MKNLLRRCAGSLVIFMMLLCMSSALKNVYAADDESGQTSVPKMTMSELRALYNSIPDCPSDIYTQTPVREGSNYRIGILKEEALLSVQAKINYYRKTAGLKPVSLTASLNESAAWGALTDAMIGELTHYPSQPSVMTAADYEKGCYACSHSNIAAGYSLTGSIDGYMNDTDSSNVYSLGHRRWVISPYTSTMGIGMADAYSALRVFGTGVSQQSANDFDFIAWPSSGNNLTDTFDGNEAWSVNLSDAYDYPERDEITVRLTRKNDGRVWVFNSATSAAYSYGTDFFTVGYGNFGLGKCIIFRPGNQGIYFGDYQVEISGLKKKGADATLTYSVCFAPLDGDISGESYSALLKDTVYEYSASQIRPVPVLSYKGKNLKAGTDYTLSYSNNIEAGRATVTLTGKGNYSGSKSLTFRICKNIRKITFDLNGGSGDFDSITIADDELLSIPTAYPTRFSYSFLGWSTRKTAKSPMYKAGEQVSITADTTLYAVWKAPAVLSLEEKETKEKATISVAGTSLFYKLVPSMTASYTIKTSPNGIDTIGKLYDADGNQMAYNDDTDGLAFEIVQKLTAGTTYYLEIRLYSSRTGSFDLTISRDAVGIENASVSLSYTKASYTGLLKKPVPKVVLDGKTLTAGIDYSVSYKNNREIGTALVIIRGLGSYPGQLSMTFTIRPAVVSGLAAASSTSGIKLTWESVKGAEGYYIYRRTASTEWKRYKTITSPDTLSFTNSSVTNGYLYYYRIAAFANADGKEYMSAYSDYVTYKYLNRTYFSSLESEKTGSFTAVWNSNEKATGYQLEYASGSSFSDKVRKTYLVSSGSVHKVSSLISGKKYYVRVRYYYKTSSGKYYYSAWSYQKTVTVK